MNTTRLTYLLVTFLLLFGAAACASDTDETATDEMAESDTAATENVTGMTEESNTIVDAAMDDGRFSMLVSALQRTGLAETLRSDGPFTVFAPTDEAFNALPGGSLDSLSQEELTNILTYHVLNGRMMGSDISGMQALPTSQGGDLQVSVGGDGTIMVNGARVTTADLQADNGVIHVIDQVLMPPSDTEM